MESIKENMIKQARSKYTSICLPPNKSSYYECFTFYRDKLIFWFNTEDHSTHVIVEQVNQ